MFVVQIRYQNQNYQTIIGQEHKLIQIRYAHNNDDGIHVGSRRKAVVKRLQT